MNLLSLKKRLAFIFPGSTTDGAVAEYVEDFDRVLESMGCTEQDLLLAIDANWDAWKPTYR